jgi:hypothetical protein
MSKGTENRNLILETGTKRGVMREVYELDVYKLAEGLSDRIWFGFDTWAKKVQHTIGYQIIKASDSIAANLAEGYGGYTPSDR